MHPALKVFLPLLALLSAFVTLPARAADYSLADLRPAALNDTVGQHLPDLDTDVRRFTLGQVVAVVGGAVVVGTAADAVFSGGLVTLLGIVAGGILGNQWYKDGMWPFRQ